MRIRFYDIEGFREELERRGITEVRKEILTRQVTAKGPGFSLPFTESYLVFTASDGKDILELRQRFDSTVSYALQPINGEESGEMRKLREKASRVEEWALEKLHGFTLLPGVIVQEEA